MTELDAHEVWSRVAQELSIRPEATLVRLGKAAVWQTDDDRIVRIDDASKAGLISRLDAWLSLIRADAPMLAPLPIAGGEHYRVMFGHVVTMWPLAKPVSQVDFDWNWLGRSLAHLHATSVPGLTRCLPSDYVAASIEALARTGSYPHAIEPLRQRVLALAVEIDWDQHPAVTTHGDAHPGNTVETDEGLRLVDFESLGKGSPAWDFMAIALLNRRYGVAAESVEHSFRAYGRDLRSESSFESMLSLREILDGVASARRAVNDPLVRPEADKRIVDLLTGRPSIWVSVHPGNEAELRNRGISVSEAIARGVASDGGPHETIRR